MRYVLSLIGSNPAKSLSHLRRVLTRHLLPLIVDVLVIVLLVTPSSFPLCSQHQISLYDLIYFLSLPCIPSEFLRLHEQRSISVSDYESCYGEARDQSLGDVLQGHVLTSKCFRSVWRFQVLPDQSWGSKMFQNPERGGPVPDAATTDSASWPRRGPVGW